MKTPARQVVELFMRTGRPLDAQALARLAGIAAGAARAFLSRLAALGVLHADGLGNFLPGERAAAWMAAVPRTRPGGNARTYRISKQLRALAAEVEPRKKQASARRRHRAADLTSTQPGNSTMEQSGGKIV